MKTTFIFLVATAVTVSVCLSGCNGAASLTASQIITRTLAAMRNVTSYQYTMSETVNTTTYNNSKQTVTHSINQRTGSINTTLKETFFQSHLTLVNSTRTKENDQFFRLVNNITWIGNNTNGTIKWGRLNVSAKQSWYQFSLLDFDVDVLSGQNRQNPMQRNAVDATRLADATINHTSCYVLLVKQSIIAPAGRGMNTSENTQHTYYIDKTTYLILSHSATVTVETRTDATQNPPNTLKMHVDALGSQNYFNYNIKVTIETPLE